MPPINIVVDVRTREQKLEQLVKIARAEIGVSEVPGQVMNPRIKEYFDTTGYHPTDDSGATNAWCSAFIGFVVQKAGLVPTGSASAKSWEKWGVAGKPTPGAIVTFERSGGSGRHVGLIESVDYSTVNIISGNDRDSVRRSVRPIESIMACRVPE